MTGTISTSLLVDLTVRNGRGQAVGRFNALVGLAAAVGVSASGFAVKQYGLTVLFYCASAAVALSAVALFCLTEPKRSEEV